MSNTGKLTRTINVIAKQIPPGIQWDVMLTHDESVVTVFNIWVRNAQERARIHTLLSLRDPAFATDTDEEFPFTQLLTIAVREC